jgi:hypothetical protein
MRPHRTDGISLSFGLIFIGVVLFWAFARVITVDVSSAGWIVAGALLLFGVLGVRGALRSGRHEQPAPVQAEAVVEVPEGVSHEMHADIVRELLGDARSRPPGDPRAEPDLTRRD